jgi:Na+/phosphate symporter
VVDGGGGVPVNLSFGIALAVCIAGAIIYWITAHPKLAELARLMFGCGLLAVLLRFAGEANLTIGR